MKIAAVAVAVTVTRRPDQETQSPKNGETLCSESDSDEEDSDTSLSGFLLLLTTMITIILINVM